jgi:hypothetical protein
MSLGRAFASKRDWTCARLAFDRAVRARPYDATAYAERGYVRLRAGEVPQAPRDRVAGDLDYALALTKDPGLLAQIWFNVASAKEARGDADTARIALAIAEGLGSKAARTKLGNGASRCTATWTSRPQVDSPVARGWAELADARGRATGTPLCEDLLPAPNAAQSARERACRGCFYGDSAPASERDAGDQCKGPGPWRVNNGYMHFHAFWFFIEPLGADRFYYEDLHDDEAPAPHATANGVLRVGPAESETERAFVFDGSSAELTADGRWSDEVSDDGDASGACAPDLRAEVAISAEDANGARAGRPPQPMIVLVRPRKQTYFDVATGRPLLELRVWDREAEATFAAGAATIAGAGCSARVTLRRDP